ncbi:MAG: chorismate mutase [Methylococcaceae bacterium TMED69]|nr:MAG: chorismate mutase [Methylococcaceae bacterium TMED69]
MEDLSEIEKLRKIIDEVDVSLLNLMNKRADVAKQIGLLKKNQKEPAVVYRPDREARVIRQLLKNNKGPLSEPSVEVIFKDIISSCRSLEAKLRIAYLGPEGSYTEAAMVKHFGKFIEKDSCNDISSVFKEIEICNSDYGIVPIENSYGGSVTESLDSLISNTVYIIGEVYLVIKHNLLSTEANLKDIETVFAHQQSLSQCRVWLKSNLPDANLISVSSNSAAVQKSLLEKNSASIASLQASEIYKIPSLEPNIADSSNNTTRFIILGKKIGETSGQDRTSIAFGVKNQFGALYDVLTCFYNAGISLSKIESRPSGQDLWEYIFYVDLVGHCDDEPLSIALKEVSKKVSMLKILGSYPQAF